MNILTRFLNVFRSIPVFHSISLFRSVDYFYGVTSIPVLVRFSFRGTGQWGDCPCLIWCIITGQQTYKKIVYWIQVPNAGWCQSEANACISSSLPALVTAKLPLSPKQYSSCPIVPSALRIWSQFRQNFNLTEFSIYGSITTSSHKFDLLPLLMPFPPNLNYNTVAFFVISRFFTQSAAKNRTRCYLANSCTL